MTQLTSRIATAQIIAILELVGFDPIGQDRHTSYPRSRAEAPVRQRATSRRGHLFFMVPRCRLHTCRGWIACVLLGYARAGHVAAAVAARRHMIRPEERVLYQ